MEILNQDKSVYDIIEKKDNNAPLVENLLPPPEEPQLPVIAAQPQPAPAPTPAPAEPDTTSVVLEKAEGIIKVAEAPKAVPAIEPKPEPEKRSSRTTHEERPASGTATRTNQGNSSQTRSC
ncbi:MAG: hypothetical protein ACLU99_14245 [Alphaproteobacteria bacterium]